MTDPNSHSGLSPDLSNVELARKVHLFLSGKRHGLSQITVSADHGTISLSGTVATYFLRQIANSLAKKVAGVRHVRDGLEVERETLAPTTL